MIDAMTNLFPAILIAGPPHSGKSVLSFLLSIELRQIGSAHYLLRADPSGEGDWFHLGKAAVVRSLRQEKKGHYSPAFVERLQYIIDNRQLPLLVDIGGSPRGEQFALLKACTHSILLYRSQAELTLWQNHLQRMELAAIAELRSSLTEAEKIQATHPQLQGIISGLDRHNWQTGAVFGALFDRVAGICHYEEGYLEKIHRAQAPWAFLSERALARAIGVPADEKRLVWAPRHLRTIAQQLPEGEPRAIYGRGPVWLAAMLAVQARPAAAAFFDARYGWVTVPKVRLPGPGNVKVQIKYWDEPKAVWLSLNLLDAEVEPGDIEIPPIEGEGGLVVSGALPRWYYAALAREFASHKPWVAIDDPANNRVVVIHSQYPGFSVGDVLPRPDL